MPSVYAPPHLLDHRADPATTFCQVFVGPGAAFEGSEGLRLPQDFPDGPRDTILVAEAAQAVPWSKPADLAYRPDGPLPPLGGIFNRPGTTNAGALVAFADGSVHFFRTEMGEADLRAAITRNGGEGFNPEW
jgi:hypothetical protein